MSLPRLTENQPLPGRAAPGSTPCRWLISLDYDGTLRSSGARPIEPEFFRQMEIWRPFGVRWGINTGRTADYLLTDLVPGSPFMPDFICTCERYVYLADDDGILRPEMEHNELCQQHNMALRHHLAPILHQLLDELKETRPELDWIIAKDDPLSIEAIDSATMDILIPYLKPLATRGISIQRADRYMRFSDDRYSKGTALSLVLQRWGIPEDHLMIMGDGQNDLDAFRMFPAAWCAAPQSAHPEVLAWLRLHTQAYISHAPGVLVALRRWFNECVIPSKTQKVCSQDAFGLTFT